jgi:hypothetical protein
MNDTTVFLICCHHQFTVNVPHHLNCCIAISNLKHNCNGKERELFSAINCSHKNIINSKISICSESKASLQVCMRCHHIQSHHHLVLQYWLALSVTIQCGGTFLGAKSQIKDWVTQSHYQNWRTIPRCKHSKRCLIQPSRKTALYLSWDFQEFFQVWPKKDKNCSESRYWTRRNSRNYQLLIF